MPVVPVNRVVDKKKMEVQGGGEAQGVNVSLLYKSPIFPAKIFLKS
jgi:hypothetical protein